MPEDRCKQHLPLYTILISLTIHQHFGLFQPFPPSHTHPPPSLSQIHRILYRNKAKIRENSLQSVEFWSLPQGSSCGKERAIRFARNKGTERNGMEAGKGMERLDFALCFLFFRFSACGIRFWYFSWVLIYFSSISCVAFSKLIVNLFF